MYVEGDPAELFAGFGALQTGTLLAGSVVEVPAGTMVTTFLVAHGVQTPTSVRRLTQPLLGTLIASTAISGDVTGRDLVSVGGSAALAYDTGAQPPALIEGTATKSGWLVTIPAGTVVVIRQLEPWHDVAITPGLPGSQADCPAGMTFYPQTTTGDVVVPARCVMSPGGTSGAAVPWYKRTSTYVVGGLATLVLIGGVALARRGR